MGTVKTRALSNQDAEPYLIATKLPRCAQCGAQHPRSLKPLPLDQDHCHICGAASVEGETIYVKAALGGPWGALANVFLKLGRWLREKSREV